jgi:spermidine synthase
LGATAQLARKGVRPALRLALATIGFTSVVAQIVLLRELFISSYGNELSLGLTLALWLLWTAIGSAFLGRLARRARATLLLAILEIVIPVALFASILLVRSSRTWWDAMPGEVLGPVPIVVTSFATLALFCPISGWLFAAGARAYTDSSRTTTAQGGSSTYLLEAAGSALGGIIASIFFVRFLDSLQIAAVVAGINFVVAISLAVRNRSTRFVLTSLAVVVAVGAVPILRRFELYSVSISWPGFRVVAARNSRYGSLAVVETEGNRSVVQNGLVLFTVPDPASAEEAVHFPLLEHASPRSVLLIGGGLNGSLAEILKYLSIDRVDYVELDPEVLHVARDHFPQAWTSVAADPRLHMHHLDGRLFLKSVDRRFDVVILNLPEPQTAQLNRFYTEEFFRDVRDRLAPNGVFGFQLHAAEEYISPDLAQFLGCIHSTLRRVFTDVTAIPGENVHFLASPSRGVLTTDSQVLLRRLRERGVQTTYVREYYLPFRMSPERITDLREQVLTQPELRLNRDFTPIAYYFDVALWGSQFSRGYRSAFLAAAATRFRSIAAAIAVLVLLAAIVLARSRRTALGVESTAGFAVAVTGMTLIGTEVLLLLGFQAVYGYVFTELAVIVAAFMAGMAVGSWWAQRGSLHAQIQMNASDLRRLLMAQTGVMLMPLVVMTILAGASHSAGMMSSVFARAAFPGVAILCGFAGGYQFPIAMQAFSAAKGNAVTSAGALYGLDLLGASVGALAITGYILPVFGFLHGAALMILANLGPVVLSTVVFRRLNASPARD